MRPIIVFNSIVPRLFKSEGCMLFPFIFIKSPKLPDIIVGGVVRAGASVKWQQLVIDIEEQKKILKHETIHFNQCLKYWVIGFYLLNAYYNIRYGYEKNRFEIEAHAND